MKTYFRKEKRSFPCLLLLLPSASEGGDRQNPRAWTYFGSSHAGQENTQLEKDAKNIWERGFQLDFCLLQPLQLPQALFLTPVGSRSHKILVAS